MGGILLFSPTVWAELWGGDEGDTQEHTQERTRKCCTYPLGTGHWEIKGRFPKRVVLANVPSFRFSFRGNIRRNHPPGNHPPVNTKKAHREIKGRFPKGRLRRTYPRPGPRPGGTPAETTLLETTLLRTPELGVWPTMQIRYFAVFVKAPYPKNL